MDEGRLLADYASAPRRARVLVKLNVRAAPTRSAAIVARLDPAQPMQQTVLVDRLVEAEAVLGNDRWYRRPQSGDYLWAGGLEPVDDAPALPQAMRTHLKGPFITVLDQAELAQIYGDLQAQPTSGGNVRITAPNWEADNLRLFNHPVLAAIGFKHLKVHRKAEASFQAVFDSIAAAGLAERILSCGGTFAPRYVNHDPGTGKLSSHSWGIAIDLNVAWNGYRKEPAEAGTVGSVRELVPHFTAQGFAWGGHFSAASQDGMHFELARLDL